MGSKRSQKCAKAHPQPLFYLPGGQEEGKRLKPPLRCLQTPQKIAWGSAAGWTQVLGGANQGWGGQFPPTGANWG